MFYKGTVFEVSWFLVLEVFRVGGDLRGEQVAGMVRRSKKKRVEICFVQGLSLLSRKKSCRGTILNRRTLIDGFARNTITV